MHYVFMGKKKKNLQKFRTLLNNNKCGGGGPKFMRIRHWAYESPN